MSFGLSTRNSLGLGASSSLALSTRRAGANTPALIEFNYQTATYLESGTPYTLATAPGWTFSRTTAGYGTSAAGVMTSFAIDAARVTDQGLLIEAAATNLYTRSEPTVAQLAFAQNVTNVAAPATVPFTADQWIALDNSATTGIAVIEATLAAATVYNMSVFVETLDGSQPVLGESGAGSEDFAFEINGGTNTISNTVYTRLAGNVWRVSADISSVGGGAAYPGIDRFTTQNTRALKFTGFQITLGSGVNSYIKCAGSATARGADVASQTFGTATSARVVYDTGSAAPAATSPLNLGASSGAAWVGHYVQTVLVR